MFSASIPTAITTTRPTRPTRTTRATTRRAEATANRREDLCAMPGDPSMVLHVSCEMQLPHKSDFMKQMSKHIAETLNKPETYVCVTVHDDVTMVWGGEEQPCALGTLKSIGGINLENNKKLMQHLCETLERDFMIPKNRVYVEFVDMERVNCGFDGATFGG